MREIILDELPGEKEFAKVSRWYVEEGDQVFTGDEIADLEVGGKVITIQSSCAGEVSELFFEIGDEIEVGEVLALIDDENEDILDEAEEEAEEEYNF